MEQAQKEQARPDPGPLTTRIVGELVPPDGPPTPAHPEPEQLEVTQPYLPAIRDETPEFAKRLNPDPAPPRPAPPGAFPEQAPGDVDAARQAPPRPPAPASGSGTGRTTPSAAPAKRRSLARRMVRRIIGPDLLRKDPPPKRK